MKKFFCGFCFILVTQCATDPAFWQGFNQGMYGQQPTYYQPAQVRQYEPIKTTHCNTNSFTGSVTCYTY